eukprot:1720138-Alexandrium_andersonii.AAC.1
MDESMDTATNALDAGAGALDATWGTAAAYRALDARAEAMEGATSSDAWGGYVAIRRPGGRGGR